MLVLAIAFSIGASEKSLNGDVNNDSSVNIADVTALIDYLLSDDASIVNLQAADCNGDNSVNIADVTTLIDYLLTGNWPANPEPERECVDLGLPSGTLWATCNVGATNPEECGDYFAWGETVPNKEYYWWNTYQWVEIVENNKLYYTKYNTKSDQGIVDDKTELDPEDDAAYVNWGPQWRMPTRDQVNELIENCIWEWTQVNGMNGYLVTGSNENTMFLPAAGIRLEYDLDYLSEMGFYWGRTICIIGTSYVIPGNGGGFRFGSDNYTEGNGSRMNGCAVRAVRVPQQ